MRGLESSVFYLNRSVSCSVGTAPVVHTLDTRMDPESHCVSVETESVLTLLTLKYCFNHFQTDIRAT